MIELHAKHILIERIFSERIGVTLNFAVARLFVFKRGSIYGKYTYAGFLHEVSLNFN